MNFIIKKFFSMLIKFVFFVALILVTFPIFNVVNNVVVVNPGIKCSSISLNFNKDELGFVFASFFVGLTFITLALGLSLKTKLFNVVCYLKNQIAKCKEEKNIEVFDGFVAECNIKGIIKLRI